MEKLIYLDTNIYLDYLENRTDRLRPLGEFAFQLIKRTIECEFKIIISDHVLDELEKNIDETRIKELFKDLKENNKLLDINITKEDKEKAKKLSKKKKTHYSDTLHAILSNKAGAKFLVTRNIKHFAELKDLVKLIYPETI